MNDIHCVVMLSLYRSETLFTVRADDFALQALIAARDIHNLYGTTMNKSFVIVWERLNYSGTDEGQL